MIPEKKPGPNVHYMEHLRKLLRDLLNETTCLAHEDFMKDLLTDAGCKTLNIHLAMLIYNLNKQIAGSINE